MIPTKADIEEAREIFRRWSDGISHHMTEEYKKFEEGKRFRCTKDKVSFWADDYINATAEALTRKREAVRSTVIDEIAKLALEAEQDLNSLHGESYDRCNHYADGEGLVNCTLGTYIAQAIRKLKNQDAD